MPVITSGGLSPRFVPKVCPSSDVKHCQRVLWRLRGSAALQRARVAAFRGAGMLRPTLSESCGPWDLRMPSPAAGAAHAGIT